MQPYKKLFTYWYSVIIYDLTVEFTQLWIKSWKLREQMNGAARSGKQNVVEGSDSLRHSLKTGIKLTGTAKSSIEELIGDLEDFLRQRKLNRWSKDDRRIKLLRAKSAKLVRNLSLLSSLGSASQNEAVVSNLSNLRASPEARQNKLISQLPLPKDPEEAANLLLTLCHQATYLLNKQIEALEKKHQTEGGYTEKLYQRRKKYRSY